jgi:hypothetical protein
MRQNTRSSWYALYSQDAALQELLGHMNVEGVPAQLPECIILADNPENATGATIGGYAMFDM